MPVPTRSTAAAAATSWYGFERRRPLLRPQCADQVVEFAGGGFDRVFAGASFTLEAGSEVEMLTTDNNLAHGGDQPDRQ